MCRHPITVLVAFANIIVIPGALGSEGGPHRDSKPNSSKKERIKELFGRTADATAYIRERRPEGMPPSAEALLWKSLSVDLAKIDAEEAPVKDSSDKGVEAGASKIPKGLVKNDNNEKLRVTKPRNSSDGAPVLRDDKSMSLGIDGFSGSPSREARYQTLKETGGVIIPRTFETVFLSGASTKMVPKPPQSILRKPPGRTQILKRYWNDDPAEISRIEAILGGAVLQPESIVEGIVDPVYEEKTVSREEWDPIKRRYVEEVYTYHSLRSGTRGFFYTAPNHPNVLFRIDSEGDTLNGRRDRALDGLFTAPSYPTAKLPVRITPREFIMGRTHFSRDLWRGFLDLDELKDEADPKYEYFRMNPQVRGEWSMAKIIDFSDTMSMHGMDPNRALVYNFTMFKDSVKPNPGEYFLVASPHTLGDFYAQKPRLFRINIGNGSIIEYELDNRGPHKTHETNRFDWYSAFFRIAGINVNYNEMDPLLGVGDQRNRFLGFIPRKVEPLIIEGIRSGKVPLYEGRTVVSRLSPVNGPELYDLTILLGDYLAGVNVLPPDTVNPVYWRMEMLRKAGMPDFNGLQIGTPEEILKGTSSAPEKVEPSGKVHFVDCLEILGVLPQGRKPEVF